MHGGELEPVDRAGRQREEHVRRVRARPRHELAPHLRAAGWEWSPWGGRDRRHDGEGSRTSGWTVSPRTPGIRCERAGLVHSGDVDVQAVRVSLYEMDTRNTLVP
jgi:hypothetical protein